MLYVAAEYQADDITKTQYYLAALNAIRLGSSFINVIINTSFASLISKNAEIITEHVIQKVYLRSMSRLQNKVDDPKESIKAYFEKGLEHDAKNLAKVYGLELPLLNKSTIIREYLSKGRRVPESILYEYRVDFTINFLMR